MSKINLTSKLVDDIRLFNAPILAAQILKNNQESELIKVALEKDKLLSSRAMWVLSHCSDIDFNRIKPYHIQLILNLKNKDLHNGVIRNTLRLFQKHKVPKKQEAFILDKCYEYVQNVSEAIAVRAFAITVIFNISKSYPDLMNELLAVLNNLSITDESPGIRSRIKNTVQAIHKFNLNQNHL